MNIDPNLWGSSSWKFMHYITIAYPQQSTEEIKRSTYNFFTSLKDLLPCEKCRYNFGYHLQRHPLTDDILSSRNKLIHWLIDIHNDVNISIGKPTLTYDQALLIYMNPEVEPFLSKSINSLINMDSRLLTIIIILIIIVLLIILVRSRCLV